MKDQSETNEGVVYHLSRVDWDLFATLTWKGRVPRPRVAYRHLWRFLRQSALIAHREFPQVLFAVRREDGEINGRSHFHVLIGGLKSNNLTTLSHRFHAAWKRQTGGHSHWSRYDRSLSGVAYMAEILALKYEQGKYGSADQVSWSRSVERVLRSLSRIRTKAPLATAQTKRVSDGKEARGSGENSTAQPQSGLVYAIDEMVAMSPER